MSASLTSDRRDDHRVAVGKVGSVSGPGPGGRALGVVLSLLTVFGPISMDLYLPVLPALTADLGASTSAAQLTVTACLLGLALGQVVAGPLSDRFGRRRPLLIGVGAFIAASAWCAVSPTIEMLVAARLVQGLTGAVGIVIAQAAGRDLYSGARLLRYYGRLTVLGGLAAIVGPVIGGQLATVTDWRGTFVFLAVVGVMILAASAGVLRETLPPDSRRTGGLADTGRVFRRLLADRVFLGAVLVTGFVNAALFAYLSGATFVLQGIYGLSPQGYSYAFGLNSLGFMVFGFLAGRLAERWSVRGTLVAGLIMVVAGASGVLLTAAAHLPLAAMVVSLLTMVSGVAVTTPPSTSLALENYPEVAGSAASLLGLARFAFGGVTAPLVGLAGPGTAVPLGVVTVTAALLGVGGYVLLRPPAAGTPEHRAFA
ncbi:multidrug effflux MFS transporter [Rhodococcus sp. 14C212]|uniref:multidrug effflux MFS transporter n=1 Tax=Rhodococcus sp. 14C212 TaxID=2711209 RepID=UPI0013EBD9AD|nr:multidrug effflux MFS transporter [Rhodococcus sp. 14C212]NGP07738.1 multidrug effflux MFS transporter [Rhodococcus sp. 14C212]